MSYSQVSAGYSHTALLCSDGNAVACGKNGFGQCNIPALDEGLSYTQVSAGVYHSVFLKSDGNALACGRNGTRQCNIPSLDPGTSYTQVSAGALHTVLLRSDGKAVACGQNTNGQRNIPRLDCFIRKFLQAAIIPCFSAVMARRWPAEEIDMDNAKFPVLVSAISIVIWLVICQLATLPLFFNSIFSPQMRVFC